MIAVLIEPWVQMRCPWCQVEYTSFDLPEPPELDASPLLVLGELMNYYASQIRDGSHAACVVSEAEATGQQVLASRLPEFDIFIIYEMVALGSREPEELGGGFLARVPVWTGAFSDAYFLLDPSDSSTSDLSVVDESSPSS